MATGEDLSGREEEDMEIIRLTSSNKISKAEIKAIEVAFRIKILEAKRIKEATQFLEEAASKCAQAPDRLCKLTSKEEEMEEGSIRILIRAMVEVEILISNNNGVVMMDKDKGEAVDTKAEEEEGAEAASVNNSNNHGEEHRIARLLALNSYRLMTARTSTEAEEAWN